MSSYMASYITLTRVNWSFSNNCEQNRTFCQYMFTTYVKKSAKVGIFSFANNYSFSHICRKKHYSKTYVFNVKVIWIICVRTCIHQYTRMIYRYHFPIICFKDISHVCLFLFLEIYLKCCYWNTFSTSMEQNITITDNLLEILEKLLNIWNNMTTKWNIVLFDLFYNVHNVHRWSFVIFKRFLVINIISFFLFNSGVVIYYIETKAIQDNVMIPCIFLHIYPNIIFVQPIRKHVLLTFSRIRTTTTIWESYQ